MKKFIGFDAGEARRRYGDRGDDPRYDYWYPLMDWGWDRARCEQVIADEGLPVPAKSACFFCPATKKHEIATLSQRSPDLHRLSLDLEVRYLSGKHFREDAGSTRGLGRRFAWHDLVLSEAPCAQPCRVLGRRAEGRGVTAIHLLERTGQIP